MTSVLNLTGRGVIHRLRRIEETPRGQRDRKFGRGWPWQVCNGGDIIREQFPELKGELDAIYQPLTFDDLIPIGPSSPVCIRPFSNGRGAVPTTEAAR